MLNIKEKSIIISSIVRNAEKGLVRNIPEIKRLCQMFRGYKVFVYENDSTDKTKQLLQEWHDSAPDNVFVSLNDTSAQPTIPSSSEVPGINPFYSYKRIDKMATLRNAYMQFVDDMGWFADYLVVVDLDVARISADNIMSSFVREDWDAVTAFGYSTSPKLKRRYHDTYALTEFGDEANPQSEEKIVKLAEKYAKLKGEDSWIRVFSAFGGLAIYRFECVRGMRYSVMKNDDPRVQVRCEHYSIYHQMKQRGFDRVYINPAMSLKYQDLTLKIIYNSVKRLIGGGCPKTLKQQPCDI